MCNGNMIVLERKTAVSDKVAEENIKKFLRSLKSSGRKSLNILDLLLEFKYPANQINRIMARLEKDGLVKEDWPPW